MDLAADALADFGLAHIGNTERITPRNGRGRRGEIPVQSVADSVNPEVMTELDIVSACLSIITSGFISHERRAPHRKFTPSSAAKFVFAWI